MLSGLKPPLIQSFAASCFSAGFEMVSFFLEAPLGSVEPNNVRAPRGGEAGTKGI